MKPKRIQRRRTKGWRMPPGAIYVGRPTKWGNPFKAGEVSPQNCRIIMDAEHAVQLFRVWCESKAEAGILDEFLELLRGKDLACFCDLNKACHADVLLELANQ